MRVMSSICSYQVSKNDIYASLLDMLRFQLMYCQKSARRGNAACCIYTCKTARARIGEDIGN